MTTNCTVCLEPIDTSQNNYCVSQCNHLFHLDCLLTVSKNNFKCPICNGDLAEQTNNEINELDNIEPNNFKDNYIEYEQIEINELFNLVIGTLYESKLKTKIIEIKKLLDTSLENNKNEIFNNYFNICINDDFNELCCEYDCEYNIDAQLLVYLLKIKEYFTNLE